MSDERPCRYIENDEALRSLIEELRPSASLALDTESNSFFVYHEQVCLIQLSTETADFALDPLHVDVRPLGELLADPKREIVVHAADYDVRCLRRDFGFQIARLFDTMLAARLLGRKEVGLAAILRDYFGLKLAKGNQRSDWGRRPLTSEQLAYAYMDTRHLLPLRDRLREEIEKAKLTDAARKQFDRQAECVARVKVFDPEEYRQIRGARALSPVEKSVLRALFRLREECAEGANRPPFKICGEDVLLALARSLPKTPEALAATKGLGESTLRRFGEVFLKTIAEASAQQEAS